MRSFGKQPFRSLDSFGVAGILGSEGRVFYDNLFSTRHVGQVSDLLVARLRNAGPDEVKLRATLAYALHEAFGLAGKSAAGAPAPLVALECGIDSEKLAIGVCFIRSESAPFDPSGLSDRIRANRGKGELEQLLAWLFVHADRLVIRHQPSSRRVEVVSVIGLPGKIEAAVLAGPHDLEIVALAATPPRAPKAASYVQLGDLDYHRLLQDNAQGKGPGPGPLTLGEILASTSKVESGMPASLAVVQAREGGPESEHVVVVGGSSQSNEDDQAYSVASGEAQQQTQEGRLGAADAARYNAKINELQLRVMQLEAELRLASEGAAVPEGVEDPGKSAAKPANDRASWFSRLIGKKDTAEAKPERSGERSESDLSSAEVMAPSTDEPGGAGTVERVLLQELGRDIDKTFREASSKFAELKKEVDSPRAKRLLDGLMGELVGERAKLQDAAKKLNLTIRQTEIEFHNKTQALTEELKRANEQLKQKGMMLDRNKEQLNQALLTIEQLKNQAGGAGEDQAAYKQKYMQQSRILAKLKEENLLFMAKVEDLKKQLSTEKTSSKGRGPSQADFTALQARLERAQRQADEFKKVNQQLFDKLNEQRKDRAAQGPGMEEVRKRLEAVTKMMTVSKKDQERLNQKIEEMRKEELRLKGEPNKAFIELKRAKSAGSGASQANGVGVPKKDQGSGSGEGGGQAA